MASITPPKTIAQITSQTVSSIPDIPPEVNSLSSCELLVVIVQSAVIDVIIPL